MKLHTIIWIPVVALLAACGNKAEESTAMDHSGHDHAAMTHSSEAVDTAGLGVAYPDGAHVHFANLVDGQRVQLPYDLQMGVSGMEVEAAGAINYGKGHHHIIIDGAFMQTGTSVPFDGQHIHFGKGQTSFLLDSLSIGQHSLTLQFANGAHLSYGEGLSATITIEVYQE